MKIPKLKRWIVQYKVAENKSEEEEELIDMRMF